MTFRNYIFDVLIRSTVCFLVGCSLSIIVLIYSLLQDGDRYRYVIRLVPLPAIAGIAATLGVVVVLSLFYLFKSKRVKR